MTEQKPYLVTPADIFLGTVPADRPIVVVPTLNDIVVKRLRADGSIDFYAKNNALLRKIMEDRRG